MKSENEKSSFKELTGAKKMLVLFLVIASISILFGGFFLVVAGFFGVFGVQYDSVSSLLLFVLCYVVMWLIMDLFSMIVVGLASLPCLGKYALFFVRISIERLCAWLAIFMVDELFDSIAIPWWTELIAVLLLLMTEWAVKNKEEEK